MKSIILVLSIAILCSSCSEKIRIVISSKAHSAEKIAAEELAENLSRIYPDYDFEINSKTRSQNKIIYLGTPESLPELVEMVNGSLLSTHDGYIITHNKEAGIIYSNSPGGVINGVYGLLDRLGFGFYMHNEARVKNTLDSFSFDKWGLINEPVVEERLSFNWHNFLSGCSSWDFEHWEEWIDHSQKNGFNTIMIHGYGNMPLFNHEYNGRERWLGRIASTAEGREWRIQHCNDIRRGLGGDVFDKHYFGAEVTEVKGDAHPEAVQNLMRQVMDYAEDRDINSIISIDVDTETSNSQNIILSLPEHARFKTEIPFINFLNQKAGIFWLANPDVPEGFGYYKSQVESLCETYPALDNICLWVRIQETPLMGLKKKDLPEKWRKEYEAKISENPKAENYWRSAGIFALSKVTEAFTKAAKEINPNIVISVGSWFNLFHLASDFFIAEDVPFIFLDFPWEEKILINSEESSNQLKAIASHRKMTPVYWAQEDNSYYFGASLKPVKNLGTKTIQSQTHGYGIIHWMIKPAELYFSSMNKQLWTATLDQSLEETCREMALKRFGKHNEESMTQYFLKWMRDGKAIGRETGYRFITDRLEEPEKIKPLIEERIAILEKALVNTKTQEEKDNVLYFINMENFVYAVFEIERRFFKAQDYIIAGNSDKAKEETELCNIEDVITHFSKFSQLGGMSRGEQGLLASMNLRWYPSFVQLRQAVGLDNLRYNFSATNHELLVHEPGWQTVFFDKNKVLWETLGSHEVGGTEYESQDAVMGYDHMPESNREIIQTGLEFDDSIKIVVRPCPHVSNIFTLPSDFIGAGRYNLKLLVSTTDAECSFEIKISSEKVVPTLTKNGDSFTNALLNETNPVSAVYELLDVERVVNEKVKISNGSSVQCLIYPVEINSMSSIDLELIPIVGKLRISGLILEKAGEVL